MRKKKNLFEDEEIKNLIIEYNSLYEWHEKHKKEIKKMKKEGEENERFTKRVVKQNK